MLPPVDGLRSMDAVRDRVRSVFGTRTCAGSSSRGRPRSSATTPILVAVSVYAYGVGGEKAVGLIFLARSFPRPSSRRSRGCSATASARARPAVTNCRPHRSGRAAALGVFVERARGRLRPRRRRDDREHTVFDSAQAALTPTLARTPDELTAANAVASGIESIAALRRTGARGLLLAVRAPASCSC